MKIADLEIRKWYSVAGCGPMFLVEISLPARSLKTWLPIPQTRTVIMRAFNGGQPNFIDPETITGLCPPEDLEYYGEQLLIRIVKDRSSFPENWINPIEMER